MEIHEIYLFLWESKWERRHLLWSNLHDLDRQANLPWLVAGDFNEILYSHEKEGGNIRPVKMMENFWDVLAYCSLEDLSFTSVKK